MIGSPEVVNGIIMSRSLAMEFECEYGTSVDDVSNNRTILGGNIVTQAWVVNILFLYLKSRLRYTFWHSRFVFWRPYWRKSEKISKSGLTKM